MAKTKAETIVYPVHNGLYVNLTNRCSCACTFCIRQTADGVGQDGEGGENDLWLDHEPSFEEVMAAFDEQDMSRYEEVVFCGYGEPYLRLRHAQARGRRSEAPLQPARAREHQRPGQPDLRPRYRAGVRGHRGHGLHQPEHPPNADEYAAIVRSRFGDKAFLACSTSPAKCANTCPTS